MGRRVVCRARAVRVTPQAIAVCVASDGPAAGAGRQRGWPHCTRPRPVRPLSTHLCDGQERDTYSNWGTEGLASKRTYTASVYQQTQATHASSLGDVLQNLRVVPHEARRRPHCVRTTQGTRGATQGTGANTRGTRGTWDTAERGTHQDLHSKNSHSARVQRWTPCAPMSTAVGGWQCAQQPNRQRGMAPSRCLVPS